MKVLRLLSLLLTLMTRAAKGSFTPIFTPIGEGLCHYYVDESAEVSVTVPDRITVFGYHPWTPDGGIAAMKTLHPGNEHLPEVLSCITARGLPTPAEHSGHMPVCITDARFPWPSCVKSQNVLLMLFSKYQVTKGVPLPLKKDRFKEYTYLGRKLYVPNLSLFDNNSARMDVSYYPLENAVKKVPIVLDKPDTYTNLACFFGGVEATGSPKVADQLFCTSRSILPNELDSFCLLVQHMQLDIQDQNSDAEPKIVFQCDSASKLTAPPVSGSPSDLDTEIFAPGKIPIVGNCPAGIDTSKYFLMEKPTSNSLPYFSYYVYTELMKTPTTADPKAYFAIRRDLSALDDRLTFPIYCVGGTDPDDSSANVPICVSDPRDWPDCFAAHCIITLNEFNHFVPKCVRRVNEQPIEHDCAFRASHDMALQSRAGFAYFMPNDFRQHYSYANGYNDGGSLLDMQCALTASPIALVGQDRSPRGSLRCWSKTGPPPSLPDCLKKVCTFTQTVMGLGNVLTPNCENSL